MEIGQIQAFERAARDGSFTRAAESLGLTQPAVSARVLSLEAELGGPLFLRSGRTLRLTPLGKRFLPYAERVLAVMDDGLKEVQHFHDGRVGEVTLAAPAPFVMSLIPDPLESFRMLYPAVDIQIWQRIKPTVIDMLNDGVVTLGLIPAPMFEQNFHQLAHFQEPIRCIVSPKHPLGELANHPLRMADLYQHTIFRVTMFRRMTGFIDAVVERGRRGSGGAVVSVPMILAIRLVILGQGLTFLPQSYVQRHVDEGRLVYLEIEDMPQILSEPLLVALAGRELDFVHMEFMRLLKERWRHILVAESVK